jgi:hypothetical protein
MASSRLLSNTSSPSRRDSVLVADSREQQVSLFDSTTGSPMLAAAEEDLGVKWENVLMLGSPQTILAAREWRHVAWHLEWLARGLRDDPAEYTQANTDSGAARRHFYSAVRAELGIVGGPIPDLPWPPAWQESAQQPPDSPRT